MDPTIQGTILGSPIFRNSHIGMLAARVSGSYMFVRVIRSKKGCLYVECCGQVTGQVFSFLVAAWHQKASYNRIFGPTGLTHESFAGNGFGYGLACPRPPQATLDCSPQLQNPKTPYPDPKSILRLLDSSPCLVASVLIPPKPYKPQTPNPTLRLKGLIF